MPPEPLPFDRKELFKERKHERSESLPLGGSTPRWRDSNHYGSSHRDFAPRWGGGSNDFRRPPGHGKQGGWHLFPEESGHGYASSRSGDKMLEEENYRPSVSRGDGKYGRNGRENRGSFGQRDWKAHSWDTGHGSPYTAGRLNDVSNDQRSVNDPLQYSSTPRSDYVNTWDQLHLRDQHDNNNNNNNRVSGANGLGTNPKGDRENSLDWKPLKWNRSGSLSSRGSGFSHSSSSKSLGGADSNEGKAGLQPRYMAQVQSPSGDAAACVTSAAPSEETTSRKKQRLGWGEGLAKYEKKKVEGPEMSMNKDGAIVSTSNTELCAVNAELCASNAEPIHCQSTNLADKSPRLMGILDCASPATPSSVACSSSPGVEEKTCGRAVSVDNDVSNLCGSPSIGTQSQPEGLSFNLEKLDGSLIANIGCSIIEMLDDPSLLESSFARSTAMNKLLLLKSDISKTLEMTESEIDLLENELKSLKPESGSEFPCPAASSSFHVQESSRPCNEHAIDSNNISRPTPLQVGCCDDIVEKIPGNGPLEVHPGHRDDDIDSPGTATSKFVEPISLVKAVSSSEKVKHGDSGDLDGGQFTSVELNCLVPPVNEEKILAPADVDLDVPNIDVDSSLLVDGQDNLSDVILASNRESASRASEVFTKLLPTGQCRFDCLGVTSPSSWQDNDLVKRKFTASKRFLRFKERVVALKFRAFQRLWKEDMQLLSSKKCRPKPQKKYELSFRTAHTGYQKYRSSVRSRHSFPGGNLSLVPTTEMLNYSSKLLADSQVKLYRNALKMPALVLDNREKMASRFISMNGLVEDPRAAEKERARINPWTVEEKEIFIDKLATFGKDFRKIASFLDHKTTADCVEFYYKHHKSDCFEKTKKSKQVKSSSNYLVASDKKWSREMNAATLDALGAASVIAADTDNASGKQKLCSGRIILARCRDSKMSQGDDAMLGRSGNFDMLRSERETVAADVLAGICGSMSSEAMSSCITTSMEPGDGYLERKCQKVDSVIKWPSTSDVTENVDDETCSDDSCGEMDPTDWTDEEKSSFVQAVSSFGKDFAMISRCVRTRSRDQCKVFFSKARKCLGLDLIHPGSRNLGTPTSDDANGGGSDLEDACVLETGSVNCSDKLGTKMDEDLHESLINMKPDDSDSVVKTNLHTDLNKFVENDVMGLSDQKGSKVMEAKACDAFDTEPSSDQTLSGKGKIMNGFVNQLESQQASEALMDSVDKEAEVDQATKQNISSAECMSVVLDPSNTEAGTEVKLVPVLSSNGTGDDLKAEELSAPDSTLNSVGGLMHGKSNLSVGASSISNLGLDGKQVSSMKVASMEKAPASSAPQENNLVIANSLVQDTGSLQSEKLHGQDGLMSELVLEGSAEKLGKEYVSGDDNFQHLSVHPVLKHNESSYVLKSYSERNGTSQIVSQGCYLQKCSSSKAESSMSGLPFLSQRSERVDEHLRDHHRSLSDGEKTCRNGDVKLFGKILSNPSPQQKPNSGLQHGDENGLHPPKQGSKSSSLKFASQHNTDGNPPILKFDHNNFLGLENVPVSSYGFWDGNRIQTGFPSLPDSAMLLAKYPAAFSNYHTSSSKMEHQALQAVVKSSERNLNGVSVLPPREMGNNGMVDYQMYRGLDGTKVPPFTVDVKARQDFFSELQRLNGFEAIPGVQQHARGMVGMNVVGRGGIVVGGPCAPVSDPVAAIKMHYAKTDQYGGQNGTIIREDESWRGKGDVGR